MSTTGTAPGRKKSAIPKSTQVEVFFRDKWLCFLCRRPTVFPLTFKLLSEMVSAELPYVPIALWNSQWRRDAAPLLDELAACIDHVQAFSAGGAHDIKNFATICARCNARKSAHSVEEFLDNSKPWTVAGKHGEPEYWDGLASLFVVLAHRLERPLTRTEKEWLQEFESYYAENRDRYQEYGADSVDG